ncbi:huntingtin-interacting protein K [Suricata suricatta]|nr:huntingtin-interacting protein K [Suricata suricatta]
MNCHSAGVVTQSKAELGRHQEKSIDLQDVTVSNQVEQNSLGGAGGGWCGSKPAPPRPLRAEVLAQLPEVFVGGAGPVRQHGGIDMATEGDVELELETETGGPERPPEKPRKHDSGAADLERVTDYAEEKEIQSSNLETAMSVIGDRRSREQKAKQEREKELAKVTIKKEDLELIMTEMEISRAAAERSLREHMGNVVEALIALTN